MEKHYRYLSILIFTILISAIRSYGWNSSSYSLRTVSAGQNFALSNAEPDLFLETNPLRFNHFPDHPEFLLIKHDPEPYAYWGDYYRFRPGFFSGRLFVYGNEFVDVGDACPGGLGSYFATNRRIFLVRMGGEVFVLLLELISDIYITQGFEPQFYCYNDPYGYGFYGYGNYGYRNRSVCFTPRPIVEIAPRACVFPVRGPVGTSNSGGQGLVLDDKPILPRKFDVLPNDRPTAVDGSDYQIPSKGKMSVMEQKGKKKYYFKDRKSYSAPTSEKAKSQGINFKQVDYEDRVSGDYSRQKEITNTNSKARTGSSGSNSSSWSKPSNSRSYQRSGSGSNSNSRSSTYSKPAKSRSNSGSSSYSSPSRSNPSPSRSRSYSKPSNSGGGSSSYSKPRRSAPTPSRATSSPRPKPAAKKPASRPSPSRSTGKRGIK